MTTQNNDNRQAPNADDFLGGNFLRKEEIDRPQVVTITNVWAEPVLNSGRKKLMLAFREIEKPLILNKTNIRRLARIFGTGDTSKWRGPITLYVEPGVEFAGRVVGGIRVRPATRISQSQADPSNRPELTNGHARREEQIETEVDFY